MGTEGATFEDWRNLTAGIASLATVAGLLIGGWWAFFRFRRGRDDGPPVDVEVAARVIPVEGNQIVWCRAVLRNAGRTKLRLIPHEEAWLGIEWFEAGKLARFANPWDESEKAKREWGEVWWDKNAAARAVRFTKEPDDVGPGQTRSREVLFVLPPGVAAFVVRFSAKAVARRILRQDLSWVGETVIFPGSEDENAYSSTVSPTSGSSGPELPRAEGPSGTV